MKSFRFYTCDVFTERMFSGNQLAVVLDADGLDASTMQSIAREFNFSETTFVTAPNDQRHTARVRIFTPGRELPFAGHPTVGTAFVLASLGTDQTAHQLVLEENIGPVPVQIERRHGQVVRCTFTSARLPEQLDTVAPSSGALAEMLQLPVDHIVAPAEVWSCGVPYLVVPVASSEALMRAQLDMTHWRTTLRGAATQEVYPIAQLDPSTWQVRMFAPGAGVAEDPATGSAAAALAGWLVRRGRLNRIHSTGPSCKAKRSADPAGSSSRSICVRAPSSAVRVGGASVMVSDGVLKL